MQPGQARTSSLGVPLLPLARWVGWVAPVCPTHGVLVLSCPPAALRVCGVLGLPAPVHRCARSPCCVGCAVSWAPRLLFTGVPARCGVLRVRCPGPPAPVHRCARSVCCVACAMSWAPRLLFTGVPAPCGVLRVRCPGPPAPVHRCARSVCCVACAVSWASRLLFTGVPARCVVLRVRCPGPPAPVHRCARSVCCVACAVSWASRLLFTGVPARCGVVRVRCPGPPAPVHRCARSVCCVACAVFWAPRLLFTGVPARCVVLRVRCPGPPGSCSPVCPLGVLCCVCGVLGLPAPVHRCACSVCCVACAVSWATRLLFTGVPARCVVLRVRCPGPPGSCSPVCPLGVLCCVCGVLGLPAPVQRCARSVCCVACAVSWASRLLFTGVSARCVVLRVRCPGPPGSCSPMCPLGVVCCVCGVLGLRLLFTGVPARCVVLRVRCPGPPGSCSPVCPLGVLCCVCGVLGLRLLFTGVPARCVVLRVRCPGPPGSCSPVCPLGVVCCVCGVLGLRLLFTGVPARCVVLRVRCPGPPGSCSPVCPLGVLCCVCGVLGLRLLFTGVPARCVVLRVRCPGPPGSCSPVCPLGVVCCVCGVLGLRLLFTGVPARCVVLRVRCPGPPGSCSPVCLLGVLCCVCGVLGLRLLFTGVPARCVVLRVRCSGPPGSCSPVCLLGVLFCVCGVLGLPAPVHRCARSVCCVACAVSWASRLLFTGVPARCVVLRVRCPGPPGSCSPVCPLGVLCCVCGVLGLPAPVHRCARSVCCVACAVSWASRLLFSGVPARCVVLRVRCPGPPGSCSPVCPLGVLCCVCGVLGPPAPVHRCARSVWCVACAVSWASGSCSPVSPLGVLCCVCGVLGLPAPVHRCARSVCCVACAVSWASGSCSPVCPLGVLCCVCGVLGPPAPVHRCARSVWCVACAVSWASGSCSPVCPLGVLCCVCGVLGLPAPVHRCACSVCCVACAVSWAPRLLFTGVPARCVVLRLRCPGPPSSCSPVCPLALLCCVCGVLGPPAPVYRFACSVCCFACAVSWASRLLFTGVPARCVVLRVRCPGPPASVHRCACSVCCVACAVSWASRLLFTGVPARSVVLRVRCPGPPGSCSPVCLLGVLFCVCGVLGLPAPVHRCARSVCCVACAVSWASGFCSPVCPLGVLCCVCGVLGLPAPVLRCARSLCCVACAVSWAPRLLFTGVPARCVVLRVRCPGPPGSCSPVCPLGVLCCVCGVLGLRLLFTGVPARCVVLRVRCPGPPGSCSPVCPLGVLCCVCGVLGLPAPVHRCARSVCCVACAVSWASRLLFTGVPARCVVLRVRCPGPPGSCSPVCPLGVLCCVCGVLGLPAPVHRCARSVCCVACAVSWASRLLFTGVPAQCVVLRVRCPGPPGSCSPVCPLGVLCCVCGVLGLRLLFTGVPARCVVLRVRWPGPPGSCSPLRPFSVLCCVCGVLGLPAPVHRCARSVCCVACAVSWASRLLFSGVPARSVVLRVRCPGPPGSCLPVCLLGVLFCVCGVLGLPAPVHRCARSLCCVACAVSCASRLLFTGVPARCVVLRVRCPGPLAPVHRCCKYCRGSTAAKTPQTPQPQQAKTPQTPQPQQSRRMFT